MCTMEMAPETRETNNYEMEHQREAKHKKEESIKELGLEKASVLYIECLIYHQLWLSDRCWKTPAQVRKGMKALKYKKDKESALK